MISLLVFFFFFFKQKTAYEMLRSLVGSEMCIRDSTRRGDCPSISLPAPTHTDRSDLNPVPFQNGNATTNHTALYYHYYSRRPTFKRPPPTTHPPMVPYYNHH
eukprot:TRINITY_DN14961_c0_g1_i2.p1 TRINITY_DN14961_c0_g1~~TRINITY_DN14961_c0_g1_i2.p1  ORF type:complete len:103 (-),score=30.61 TRINITY_DN14961_c0_g1_i2:556-864(-)